MRSALWNIKRGLINDDTVTDPIGLQSRLFQEELQETLDAIKDNDLVEIVDGYCDMRFVYEGGEAKYKLNYINDSIAWSMDGSVSYSMKYKELLERQKEQLYYVEQLVLHIMRQNNWNEAVAQTLGQCYNIVCDANDKKSKEKINVKIVKNENFVSPNEAIKKILIERGYKL